MSISSIPVRALCLATILCVLGFAPPADALWETGTRYRDIDPRVTVVKTSGSYGTGTRQVFDLYQPHQDTATRRPLIILAHAGTFTSGSKDDTYVGVMAERFAVYGYPVAAINYRTSSITSESTALAAATRGIQDMNTAVRYFVHNEKTLRIHSAHIYVGGVSAGAIMALAVAFLDGADLSVMPNAHRLAVQSVSDGLLGTQHGGYRPHVAGVINLSGAIYHLPGGSKIDILTNNNDHRYVYSLHSTADPTISYQCGPFSSVGFATATYELCGGGYIHRELLKSRRALDLARPAWLDLKSVSQGVDSKIHVEYYAPGYTNPRHPAFAETRSAIDDVVAKIYVHHQASHTFAQTVIRDWEAYGNVSMYPALSTPNVIMMEDGQIGKTALISKQKASHATIAAVSVKYNACSIDAFREASSNKNHTLALVLGARKSEYDANRQLSGEHVADVGVITTRGVYVEIEHDRAVMRRHSGRILGTLNFPDVNCIPGRAMTFNLMFSRWNIKDPAVKGYILFEIVRKSTLLGYSGRSMRITHTISGDALANRLANGYAGITAGNIAGDTAAKTESASAQHVVSYMKYNIFKDTH